MKAIILGLLTFVSGVMIGTFLTAQFFKNRIAEESMATIKGFREEALFGWLNQSNFAYTNAEPSIAAWVIRDVVSRISNEPPVLFGGEKRRAYYLFIANARLAKIHMLLKDPKLSDKHSEIAIGYSSEFLSQPLTSRVDVLKALERIERNQQEQRSVGSQ